MVSTDNQDLFEKYYQKQYDFDTDTLSIDEIDEIKKLVKEKRVDFNQAPVGDKIFEWILTQEPNLSFELVEFESEKIDGMLYILANGKEKAYIILNSKKPMINQIFTATHEYYHYIHDYAEIKNKPYVCDFSSLGSVIEKKASRFAAEFLLPESVLRSEMQFFKKKVGDLDTCDYAMISILLTLKYMLPLKAVIYRLYEEGYIENISEYIDNYVFIKQVLKEIKVAKKRVEQLYSCENPYLESIGNSLIYNQMRNAYNAGLASREEILRDADTLSLDKSIVSDSFDELSDDDEDDDDTELLFALKNALEAKK